MDAKELLGRYKFTIAIVLTIIIVALVLYYSGKKAGKTESTTVDLPSDLEKNKTLTEDENKQVEQLAGLLFNDMKGITLTHDLKVWDKFLYATDRIFIATYNYFNTKYGNGETLYAWLNSESEYVLPLNWGPYKNSVITRMQRLNLY